MNLLTAPLRAAGRAALAVIFIQGGYSSALNPGQRVARAEALGVPAPAVAVRLNGAAMVVLGGAMGLGIRPRLTATLLAALLVPTTLAGHRFWEETDPDRRAQQEVHFLKNAGLLGGLLEVIGAPRARGGPAARHRVELAAVRSRARAEKAAARSRAKAEKAAGAMWDTATSIVA